MSASEVLEERERERMGGERRLILVGLAVAMVMGIGIYLRLWTLDYSVSSVDTELLRKQFDLANREAMDESAEWRLKFDVEAERANKCDKELTEVKDTLEKYVKDSGSDFNQKLAMLQKDNMALLEKVKILNQQLEEQRLKCKS
ncbi:hypothetical protein EZV62_016335 [Acer yangbiense]|uniref:Uncharacterized protein n=1 Tax=Acer yangbiense TaxID=1000413 RepID=A0A5C7HQA6_9ROSI|nr:hypothetical protein EZV62_016335 [Acer yangbiense]